MSNEFDVLLDDDRSERIGDLLEDFAQAERRALEFEPVGFYFREVEDVVQDPQPVILRIAFIGVRIS
jgi:hypothetical protein